MNENLFKKIPDKLIFSLFFRFFTDYSTCTTNRKTDSFCNARISQIKALQGFDINNPNAVNNND